MQTKIKKPVSVFLSLVMLLSVFAGLNVLPAAQAATDAPAYLTFTGTDSFSIRANSKGWDGTLEYSTDGDTWTTWTGSWIDSAGNVLYLRGTGNTKISTSYNNRWIISAAGTVACSGDIRTLLKYEDPDAAAMAANCFACLFYNCTSLTAAPELSATTLTYSCYERMFYGCTGLTAAPELPAMTLADNCYYYMFYGCTGLTAAPELPATTLKNYCYYFMFYGCTSLTAAPELPATTLADFCYYSMFKGCTGLTAAPELPATTLAPHCYQSMFSGCTGLTAAPELPATTLAISCYSSMFNGCTGLTAAPELPATPLADSCYVSMFYKCTGLSAAPELPATTLKNHCYYEMFSGCTGLTAAPELPATTLADYCYDFMFDGCTGLTAAPELPATTLADYCYGGMFEGCTGLTAAPELPATTLANNCYYDMFKGCTGLTAAPELPATTLASDCYSYMFKGCTGLTAAPELPATTLANYCYYSMFFGCTGIKLSTVQTDEYNTPYRIPTEGEGVTANNALNNMFADTGGTFTGTPSLNTTYYVPHVHRFTYLSDGASVTAACGEGCDVTTGLTLTISAPTGELVYDGETPYPAALSTDYSTTAFPGEYAITYTKNGEAFAGTPVEAGAYTASVTVGTATASVSYTVAKAEPAYTAPTGLTALCGDTLDSVTLPDGWAWNGADETTLVGEAGQRTFSATFTPADPDNYEKVTENLTVTVFEQIAENAPTCEEDGNDTYYVCGDGKYYTRSADDSFVEIDQADTVRPAIHHDYRFDSFVWYGVEAKAKYVCTKCGEADPNHTVEYAAEVTSAFTAPTATEDGFTVYTATYEDHSEDKTVVDEGSATGGMTPEEIEEAFEEYREEQLSLAETLRKEDDSEAVSALIDELVAALSDFTYDETKTLAENEEALNDILALFANRIKSQRRAERQEELNHQPCALCGEHHTGSLLESFIGVIHGLIWIMRCVVLIAA